MEMKLKVGTIEHALAEAGIDDEDTRLGFLQGLKSTKISNCILLSLATRKDLNKAGIVEDIHIRAILEWGKRVQNEIRKPEVVSALLQNNNNNNNNKWSEELEDSKSCAIVLAMLEKRRQFLRLEKIEKQNARAKAEMEALVESDVQKKISFQSSSLITTSSPRRDADDDDEKNYIQDDDSYEPDEGENDENNSVDSVTKQKRERRKRNKHETSSESSRHPGSAPRGRPKKGKIWNADTGTWDPDPNLPIPVGDKLIPRPRGRNPFGKKWDYHEGIWINANEQEEEEEEEEKDIQDHFISNPTNTSPIMLGDAHHHHHQQQHIQTSSSLDDEYFEF